MTSDAQGHVYLSWIESTGDKGHELQFSRLDGEGWSPPRRIARGQNWFVNWANHPSVAVLRNGELAAHWLVSNETKQGSYGYGLRVAHSRDAGHTWREVFSAGSNNTKGYSGFVTFLPGTQGLLAAYLTPKGTSPADEEAHIMTLSQATFGPDSALQSQGVIDPDACSCCTTTVAQTARGPIIAYRDHQPGEIRDISIVRQINGRWTTSQTVHRDGWRINACPTNGPVLAANGNRVAAAWFTAANDQPHVKVAFSGSAGRVSALREDVTVTARRVSTDKLSIDAPALTGSRLGLTPRDTPASVTVVERATIEQRGATDTQEILSSVPGMSAASPPGSAGAVTYRGFGTSQITRLFNGITVQYDAIAARPVDSWIYDGVEVFGGPSTFLFGAGAVGGSINYVTKLAERDRNEGQARVSYGSYGATDIGVSGNRRLGGSTVRNTVRGDLSYGRTNGYVDENHRYALTSAVPLTTDVGSKASHTLAFEFQNEDIDRPTGAHHC